MPTASDIALQEYADAQERLKALPAEAKELRGPIETKLKNANALLEKFLKEHGTDCLPIGSSNYLRLNSKTVSAFVSDEDLREHIVKMLDLTDLNTLHAELVAAKPQKKRRTGRGSAAVEPSVTVAEVLTAKINRIIEDNYIEVQFSVQVSDKKKRGYKEAEEKVVVPPEIESLVTEMKSCETQLKTLKENLAVAREELNERKKRTLPVIKEDIAPNTTREVELTDVNGETKTFVMTAVATNAASAAKKPKKPRAALVKVKAKQMLSIVAETCDNEASWASTDFLDASKLWKTNAQLIANVEEVLVRELVNFCTRRKQENEAKKRKKAAEAEEEEEVEDGAAEEVAIEEDGLHIRTRLKQKR